MKLDVGKMTRKEQNYGILPSMGTLGLMGMVDAFDELVHNNLQDTAHKPENIAFPVTYACYVVNRTIGVKRVC